MFECSNVVIATLLINVAFCFVVKIYNEIEIEFKAALESLDCIGWMLIKRIGK